MQGWGLRFAGYRGNRLQCGSNDGSRNRARFGREALLRGGAHVDGMGRIFAPLRDAYQNTPDEPVRCHVKALKALVELSGIEPLTSSLRTTRSPN